MNADKILVIGACGQVGSELTEQLRAKYDGSQVIASDVKEPAHQLRDGGPFEYLDVMDAVGLRELVNKHRITQVYNLAALLSATAEKKPLFGWKLNMEGLLNVLEVARESTIAKVFWPSSIAVFGPSTPKVNTPQNTVMDPNTVYGISKLAGERWCQYYFERYGIDVRSVRYPGLISYKTLPGGGTTDYAIDIFHQALKKKSYECFLSPETSLPMLYMPDAIAATIDLMEADGGNVRVRSSYNISGFSFNPAELADQIKNYIPDFSISYKPDFRQKIAGGWPGSIDDGMARKDWGWKPGYSIEDMVRDMLKQLEVMV